MPEATATEKRDIPWKRYVTLAVLGIVLLLFAYLLTLGVVLGTGKAAHAGERILDVEAPAFRAASLVGAIGATVVAVGAFVLLSAGRRDTRKLKELKSEQQRQAEESTD